MMHFTTSANPSSGARMSGKGQKRLLLVPCESILMITTRRPAIIYVKRIHFVCRWFWRYAAPARRGGYWCSPVSGWVNGFFRPVGSVTEIPAPYNCGACLGVNCLS